MVRRVVIDIFSFLPMLGWLKSFINAVVELLIKQSTTWSLKVKCYNALEALAFLKTNPVDFIFLDINMPKLTGMELATLLPPRTKIVFTTAYSEYAVESSQMLNMVRNSFS